MLFTQSIILFKLWKSSTKQHEILTTALKFKKASEWLKKYASN
jgi:hypothetical protein